MSDPVPELIEAAQAVLLNSACEEAWGGSPDLYMVTDADFARLTEALKACGAWPPGGGGR